MATLRERRVIRPSRRTRAVRVLVGAAAAVALFTGGWIVGARPEPASPDGNTPQFMLLLFGGDPASAAEAATRVSAYREWAISLSRSGRHVSGERLGDGATRVGPPAPGPGGSMLRGFFIVSAPSEQEAAALATSHPHVRHGGTIVIRRIEPTR
jgi:hypothetical protein